MMIDRNSPIPQYYQLQTWLVEQIEQGIFKPDDKIPTEEEIVEQTGLARATIRQAIQNLVNSGYLIRKRRLGTFVLRPEKDQGKKTIIAVMVHDIRSGYASEFLRGAGDEAARNGYSVLLCNTDDLYVHADFHANQILNYGISGLIYMPTAASAEKNSVIVERFRRRDIPVILFDREIPGQNLDFVTSDNYRGAYDLTCFLIAKGHRKIAITLSTIFSSENARFMGYRQALADHGIPVDPANNFTFQERLIESPFEQFARKILAHRDHYTAIFAGNDAMAHIIYRISREQGIAIPDQLSLVGYDDLPVTNMHRIALTTIHQPIYEMGQESMKLLIRRMNGEGGEPIRIELRSHLVDRGSVLALRSTSPLASSQDQKLHDQMNSKNEGTQ